MEKYARGFLGLPGSHVFVRTAASCLPQSLQQLRGDAFSSEKGRQPRLHASDALQASEGVVGPRSTLHLEPVLSRAAGVGGLWAAVALQAVGEAAADVGLPGERKGPLAPVDAGLVGAGGAVVDDPGVVVPQQFVAADRAVGAGGGPGDRCHVKKDSEVGGVFGAVVDEDGANCVPDKWGENALPVGCKRWLKFNRLWRTAWAAWDVWCRNQ